MTRIKTYLNNIADMIESQSAMAGSVGHRPDIGSNREEIIRNFLNRHLPNRLTASIGGTIVSSDNKESKQIDIVVTNDIGTKFNDIDRTFITAESVAGVITIKSTLNSSGLINALENLASIPEPSPGILKFDSNSPAEDFKKFIEVQPNYFVFAYDGMSAEECLSKTKSFYANRNDIPQRRYPRGIIVNKKYVVNFFRANAIDSFNHVIPANTFYLSRVQNDIRGYPLGHIINDFSLYAQWLNNMQVSINQYLNHAYG